MEYTNKNIQLHLTDETKTKAFDDRARLRPTSDVYLGNYRDHGDKTYFSDCTGREVIDGYTACTVRMNVCFNTLFVHVLAGNQLCFGTNLSCEYFMEYVCALVSDIRCRQPYRELR